MKKTRKRKRTTTEITFFVLVIIVLILGTLNIVKAKGLLIPEQPEIIIEENTIILDSLTLEQKIAQMVVVHGGLYNKEAWQKMNIGGIHLFAMENERLFTDVIGEFQKDIQIPFFVTADLEGCLNLFANFHDSVPVNQIHDVGAAFQKGIVEGKMLNDFGFTVNFAPVVDLDDQIWNCRSFPGGVEEVNSLSSAYVLGLQSEGIIATAKHYPGKTLVVKDPHKYLVAATIDSTDIQPYSNLFKKTDLGAVMVSHVVASGAVNSEGLPSVVSPLIMEGLKETHAGLIFTDDTTMLGLRNFYDTLDEMYVAVFNAGADVILNFDEDPNEIYRMIQIVQQAVEDDLISEDNIDDSVRKILMAKGFIVQ
jgi:beta-N-acetylhexosaminidase